MSDSVKKWKEMQEDFDRSIQNPYFENASTTSPIIGDPIVTMVKEKFNLRSKIGIDKYDTTLTKTLKQMKENILIKMQKDIKDLQQFVMMLHVQIKKIQEKNNKIKNE